MQRTLTAVRTELLRMRTGLQKGLRLVLQTSRAMLMPLPTVMVNPLVLPHGGSGRRGRATGLRVPS